MKKLVLACVLFFIFIGCDFHSHPHSYSTSKYTSDSHVIYQHYSYDACWGDTEPFWEYPDYCDYSCCTWYTGNGCWEEWCYFDYVCGWEYYQGWCY